MYKIKEEELLQTYLSLLAAETEAENAAEKEATEIGMIRNWPPDKIVRLELFLIAENNELPAIRKERQYLDQFIENEENVEATNGEAED